MRCKYCGREFYSVSDMERAGRCEKNPDGKGHEKIETWTKQDANNLRLTAALAMAALFLVGWIFKGAWHLASKDIREGKNPWGVLIGGSLFGPFGLAIALKSFAAFFCWLSVPILMILALFISCVVESSLFESKAIVAWIYSLPMECLIGIAVFIWLIPTVISFFACLRYCPKHSQKISPENERVEMGSAGQNTSASIVSQSVEGVDAPRQRKRLYFILISLIGFPFGVQFLYARRYIWFAYQMSFTCILLLLAFAGRDTEILFLLWILSTGVQFIATALIKRDGRGQVMRWL